MPESAPLIAVDHVSKTVTDSSGTLDILRDIDFTLGSHETLAIVGASGSGKSTLLHLLGGLDAPTTGSVTLMNQPLHQLSAQKQGTLRNQHLGFIYQFHHLLAEFSAHGFTATRIDDIAKRAGLSKGGFYAHYPSKEEVFSALLASSVAIEDLDVEGIINQCNTAREFAECVVNSLYTALQQPRTMAVLHLLLTNAQHLPEAAAEWQRNTFESTCAQLTQLCSLYTNESISIISDD